MLPLSWLRGGARRQRCSIPPAHMRSEKLVCRRHHCAFHRLGITLYFASSPPQEALCTTAGHSMKSFIAATGDPGAPGRKLSRGEPSVGANLQWARHCFVLWGNPCRACVHDGCGATEIHDLPLLIPSEVIYLSLVTLIPSSVGSATISPQRCATRSRSASRT